MKAQIDVEQKLPVPFCFLRTFFFCELFFSVIDLIALYVKLMLF